MEMGKCTFEYKYIYVLENGDVPSRDGKVGVIGKSRELTGGTYLIEARNRKFLITCCGYSRHTTPWLLRYFKEKWARST